MGKRKGKVKQMNTSTTDNTTISTAWTVIPGVTIVVGTESVDWSHPKRDAILDAIKANDFESIPELISNEKAVTKFGDGKLTVSDGEIMYKGKPVDGLLYSRILGMVSEGLPVDHFVAFLEKVEKNPSFKVRRDLYEFLEYGKLPLTSEGNFLARKVVQEDFYSYQSGKDGKKVYWGVGATPEMDRRDVDDDSTHTCSSGLHVYNRDYGKSFMSRTGKFLVVEIDPENVVSIPTDYNNTKMRVCKAKVLKEVKEEDDPEFFSSLCYTSILDQSIGFTEGFVDYYEDEDLEFECDNCGEVFRNASGTCPNCGEEDCSEYVDPNICSNCGNDIEDDNNYCPSCGEQL